MFREDDKSPYETKGKRHIFPLLKGTWYDYNRKSFPGGKGEPKTRKIPSLSCPNPKRDRPVTRKKGYCNVHFKRPESGETALCHVQKRGESNCVEPGRRGFHYRREILGNMFLGKRKGSAKGRDGFNVGEMK